MKRKKEANLAAGPAEQATDDAALFGRLLRTYEKDVAAGKISPTKQQALGSVLSQLPGYMQRASSDLAGQSLQISGLLDIAKTIVHLQGTSQDGSTLPEGSRAAAVWKRFVGLKQYLSQNSIQLIGSGGDGHETRMEGIELFKKCAYAYTFLFRPDCDDVMVRRYETDVLRQLAADVREHSLRRHLTLISPRWPSPPFPQDPNAVFFSGADNLRQSLADLCAAHGLTLLKSGPSQDFASSRWNQLRACHVALFDFTAYRPPGAARSHRTAVVRDVAAVSYELGIALVLGRTAIILANQNPDLPFDVDIEPVRLQRDGRDGERIVAAVDDAMYGLQRGGEDSSLAACRDWLVNKSSITRDPITERLVRAIDADAVRDSVAFRRLVIPVLGRLGPNPPHIVFPAWPGSYPAPGRPQCFHVTPFGPKWAGKTTSTVAAACKAVKPSVDYVRGDRVMEPDIIRSIWDNLCQASHVVVDLTGLNPNVALELGIAHALGRNILLVTQDGGKDAHFPSIAKERLHRYSTGGDAGLKTLRNAVKRFLAHEV
jgi:hypothetical protein